MWTKSTGVRRVLLLAGIGLGFLATLSGVFGSTWRLRRTAVIALAAWLVFVAIASPRWRRRALALLVAAALGLGLAELGLRLVYAPPSVATYQLDAVCLHRLVPGSSKVFRHRRANGGARVEVRINSDGYRGAELDRTGTRPRVAVFGDSCVEAEFTPLERTFVAQLGRQLGSDVEAVNAGVVAYGPDQVCARMEAELGTLHPQLAVVVLFADNDYGDLLRNKMFRLDAGGQLIAHAFVVGPTLRQEFEHPSHGLLLYRVCTDAMRALRSFGGGHRFEQMAIWLGECQREYDDYVVHGDPIVRTLLTGDHYDADVSLLPDSESARYKVRLMEQVLLRMRDTAVHHGVPWTLVVVPSPIDVCADFDLAGVDRTVFPAYDDRALSQGIVAAAQRHGMPCIDLFETFQHGGHALYYHSGENHWNDEGQRLAAAVVAQAIRAQRLWR